MSGYIFINYLHIFCLCVGTCTHTYGWSWKPKEGMRSPRSGVTEACELLDVGVVNQTKVL